MTSICEKKISAEVRLIHAEQMPLYNFIILTKKQWIQTDEDYTTQARQFKSIGMYWFSETDL